MQFVSVSSNHALTGILQTLQTLHEHACLFYEKCNVDRVGKMPSNFTVYDAEIKIKYSHLNQGSLTQCYLVNKDSLVESIFKKTY